MEKIEKMINQELIKRLRAEKVWSQEHLALVSGISPRTIQRVESEGKCSIDSRKALAAAFELDVADLGVKPETTVLAANDSKREAAISWLETVDSEKYALSWKEAAPLFKSRISNNEWVKALTQVRAPLGKLISRSVKNVTEHSSLPGLPDGQYVAITLAASYEQKKLATETITLNKESNEWRVAGYFIK